MSDPFSPEVIEAIRARFVKATEISIHPDVIHERMELRAGAIGIIGTLFAALDQVRQQLAEAREALPVVRRQDFFDASLLECINETVSQLFQAQSRAEAAEAKFAEAEAENKRVMELLKMETRERRKQEKQYDALCSALWERIVTWRDDYETALAYDKKHGLRETTVELGGKAACADDLATLLRETGA